jgi:hypothetical protein
MPDLNEKLLDYVQCSATALEVAEKELTVKRAADQKVAALIPAAIEALIANERIDPADREKAAAALKDPARVLEILIKTADVNNTIRPRTLGTAVQEKKAGAAGVSSLDSPYVGRRTSEVRESDKVFLAGLGIGG